MAETGTPEVETITLGELACKRRIDSALLKLLASGGHIPAISTGNGHHRFPVDFPLTVEEAESKGRAAYDELLESTGRLVMKSQSQLRRLLEDIEDQQRHQNDVVPLGPGLKSMADDLFGRDEHRQDLALAVHELVTWNEVLGNIDAIHRTHAEIEADREMFERTVVPWNGR